MPKKSIPSYRLHRASGQAIVTLDGKMHYLGEYGSPESRKKCADLIKKYEDAGHRLPPTRDQAEITVEELVGKYLEYCEGYYLDPDGKPSQTYDRIRRVLVSVVEFYGQNAVSEFVPLSLVFLQELWVKKGVARLTANRFCAMVKRAFRWGVTRGLVPVEIWQALTAVENLQMNRTKAPEYKVVKSVKDAIIDRTLPHLPPIVRDMVQVQRLGGWRPQDVFNLRAVDIDRNRTDGVWEYRPYTHKLAWKGVERILPIGPEAQKIILPYIMKKRDNPEAFLFSPKDSMRLFYEEKRANRKSKIQPSQISRKKSKPKRVPGDQYTKDSYNGAVERACLKAGIPKWSPNQLRHSAATEIRAKYDPEHARAVLGHKNIKTTEIYAELDFEKAAKVMREIG